MLENQPMPRYCPQVKALEEAIAEARQDVHTGEEDEEGSGSQPTPKLH
jgi:hypothetical protein